jgi:hypothetical protein
MAYTVTVAKAPAARVPVIEHIVPVKPRLTANFVSAH